MQGASDTFAAFSKVKSDPSALGDVAHALTLTKKHEKKHAEVVERIEAGSDCVLPRLFVLTENKISPFVLSNYRPKTCWLLPEGKETHVSDGIWYTLPRKSRS